jgi:uncharacterized 2Fe-2S/4Fe-4S cluster protein (DUF4445 family)
VSRLKVIQNNEEQILEFTGSVPLRTFLIQHGYFVPHFCGGKGICRKCEVIVNGKKVLACRYVLSGDATVILPDREEISTVTGGKESGYLTENVCLCLDIGTTTLVLGLVSLDEKCIIRTVTVPNPQRAFGADVISRIEYCTKHGVGELQDALMQHVCEMVRELMDFFHLTYVERMYVAGNTTMLHLFFGADCTSLGFSPYMPTFLEKRTENASDLGIQGVGQVVSLPGISAFVGADIVAGINYVGIPEQGKYRILMDLGTNAEIALFSRDKIVCTAAAAGPCFEGANISCGMSARKGAVCAQDLDGICAVIGGGAAMGVCATGLIDVIANGLRRGFIDKTGYMEDDILPVCDGIALTDRDVREFQLAKSAIRAATECLLKQAGVGLDDVEGLYVAGGFSVGINVKNAAFLGLIPRELEDKFQGINNASLLGMVKYASTDETLSLPLGKAEYTDLSAEALFAELFVKYMIF